MENKCGEMKYPFIFVIESHLEPDLEYFDSEIESIYIDVDNDIQNQQKYCGWIDLYDGRLLCCYSRFFNSTNKKFNHN